MMMRIIVDRNIPLGREVFSSLGRVEVLPGREIGPESVRRADILVVRSVTRVDRDLLSGSAVRLVASATSGIDHIDTDYLQSRRIGFAYAPGSNAESVAEYVVAALFHLGRRQAFELEGKVLGIVGVGHIGKRVFDMARALGIRCLLTDPPRARREGGDGFVSLDELLPVADMVSLHVPLTREGPDATLRMVNEAFLRRIKPGAVLLNTSRGEVVDERALVKIREKLGGLVLDVWDNEPWIDPGLLAVTDCGTPHIAGYSYDGKIKGLDMVYRAACEYLGKNPEWKAEDHLAKIPLSELDLPRVSADPLGEAVLRAYPIGRDDDAMRALAGLGRGERGACFTGLRAEYPRRLEFGHFSLSGGAGAGLADCVRRKLAGLGFLVQ
jgi:erythronate-4-phosphate dehydrogenase